MAYNGTTVGKAKRKQRKEARPAHPGGEQEEPRDVSRRASVDSGAADLRSAAQASHDSQIDPSRPASESPLPSASAPQERAGAQPPPPGVEGPAPCRDREVPEPEDVEPDPRMVDYVRRVTSMIEGRKVSRAEIIEMLKRTRGQHSLARERSTEYFLRRLKEEPTKPP